MKQHLQTVFVMIYRPGGMGSSCLDSSIRPVAPNVAKLGLDTVLMLIASFSVRLGVIFSISLGMITLENYAVSSLSTDHSI